MWTNQWLLLAPSGAVFDEDSPTVFDGDRSILMYPKAKIKHERA